MKSTIKLPRVAETVDDVTVLEWLVEAGQSIEQRQILMRVETDKALVDVPSPVGGVVAELRISVDQEISTGHPILTVENG